jgi:hypothetical protein
MLYSNGYSDNNQMNACLSQMRTVINTYLQSGEIQDILKGEGASFPDYQGDVWKVAQWRDNLRREAIEQGLLEPNQQTGLGEALSNSSDHYRDFKNAVKSESELKVQIQYKRDAIGSLTKLIQTAKGLASVPNENFRKYMARILEAAENRRRELQSMSEGEFRPSRFQWTDESWQRVKEPAIWAGAMEDKRSTGFGKAIEDAYTKHETYRKATGDELKKQAREPSLQALTKVVEMATEFRDGSNHLAFKDYMKQCLEQATEKLKELEPVSL